MFLSIKKSACGNNRPESHSLSTARGTNEPKQVKSIPQASLSASSAVIETSRSDSVAISAPIERDRREGGEGGGQSINVKDRCFQSRP